jgi:hypothetical protein
MSDWQVGDMAVSIGRQNRDNWWAKGGPPKGTILPVDAVVVTADWTALVFNQFPSPHFTRGWQHYCFRKIRPDEHEACEPEFITLLKRSKIPALEGS